MIYKWITNGLTEIACAAVWYFNCVATKYFLHGWFSSKDVVINLKNCFSILKFMFKLNGGLKNIISFFFVFYFVLIE